MPKIQMTSAASFAIYHLQFLDAHGEKTQDFPEHITNDVLVTLYEKMLLTRMFDTKAINLQRTGQLGTYPSCYGQEVIGAGIGYASTSDDVLVPYYREQAALMMRGIDLADVLSYWGGDERGSLYQGSPNQQDFPICVPIATQLLHATGIAYAIKYRKEKRAVVTTIGEGGSSKGDFYEAINLAGALNLPVVFVINNNQWAISTPREEQTNCKTFAQKAIAAGIEGVQTDGNDVVAMSHVMHCALSKARSGKGPTLVEAISYRLCDHTTADDATRYIPQDQFDHAKKFEPLLRLKKYLTAQKCWSEKQDKALTEKLHGDVENIVKRFLEKPKPQARDMFDHLYETLPEALAWQRDEVEANQS
jgi:2-oxoisovalerate dehydrogenase E1 component alpha subunit